MLKAVLQPKLLPEKEETALIAQWVAQCPDARRTLHSAWSNAMRLHLNTLGPERAGAMLDVLLADEKMEDRFPAQYLWKAGPDYWPLLTPHWDRFSTYTRQALVKDVLAHKEATYTNAGPLLLLAVVDENDRIVRSVFEWVAAGSERIPAPLADAIGKRMEGGGLSSSLREKVRARLESR